MTQNQTTPPLLLTKRLTSFLASRLSPTSAHSLLLTTPTGNLLAHASRLAKTASELRAQATVASSLVAMHGGCANHVVPNALSASPSPGDETAVTSDEEDEEDEDDDEDDYDDGGRYDYGQDEDGGDFDDDDDYDGGIQGGRGSRRKRLRGKGRGRGRRGRGRGRGGPGGSDGDAVGPCAVTVQMSGGVVVIRRLKCGLLLVCIGPTERGHGDEVGALGGFSGAGSGGAGGAVSGTTTPGATSTGADGPLLGGLGGSGSGAGDQDPNSVVGSPDEGDSVTSGGARSVASVASVRAQGVLLVRRAAEETAKALDDKLGRLRAPLDAVGSD